MKRVLWPALLIALVSMGLMRLRFDVEVLNLLPGDLSVVQGLRLEQEHFSAAHELIITLESDDAELAAGAAESLARRLATSSNLVASAIWQPPWMEHPEQAVELAAFLWLNQPPEIFAELTNRLAHPQATLRATRERLATSFSPVEIARLSRDPLGLTELPDGVSFGNLGQGESFFSSANGTFRVVLVKPRGELPGYRECATWLKEVRGVVDDWRRNAGAQGRVTIQFTGGPAFLGEISGSMEGDMKSSVVGTSVFVAVLFWLAYRRLKPLVWLLCLLGLTLAVTLALAGLIFGTINVISLGFAAILMGLSADYGVVLYEEACHASGESWAGIRRHAARGIMGAALTTSAAFLALTLAGLPGLKQLGVLVAAGLLCGAVIMLFAYLPPLMASLEESRRAGNNVDSKGAVNPCAPASPYVPVKLDLAGWTMSLLCVLALVGVCLKGPPGIDHSSEPLRPRNSEAYAAAERMSQMLQRVREPVWVIVSGRDEAEAAGRLAFAQAALDKSLADGTISSSLLPAAIWPKPANQRANRPALIWLLAQRERAFADALNAGFSQDALKLSRSMFEFWTRAAASQKIVWPANEVSRWTFERFTARNENGFLVAGMVGLATTEGTGGQKLALLQSRLKHEGIWVAGWGLLGEALLDRVEGRLWLVLGPMCGLVVMFLWMTFRSVMETWLCLAVPLIGGVCLLFIMRVAGWSWNLMNLTALPLLLGAGVDYGIHIQLALKRHGGDVRVARRSTGRALAVCAATTMAGFGSLAWSGNAGLASLGIICATGIGVTFVTSLWALPLWWRWLGGRAEATTNTHPGNKPSMLYRGVAWKAGIQAVRITPQPVLNLLCNVAAGVYWCVKRDRREVLIENLTPVFQGNRAEATSAARRLITNFVHKLADLWRFEAAVRVQDRFDTWNGWETFQAATGKGRGVLMVTPHLGNWELGAALLIERGVKVLVLSDPEPDEGLTVIRQQARAAWGIETLIVGRDPFAVVEVIKRLQAGATVALLMDRPNASSAVETRLFGRSFQASIAAAELARASGCAIIPAFVIARGSHYESHILPEVTYDRAALGDREMRRKFTCEIMRAFEPMIRQHADQWYHFVPIWPGGSQPS